MYEDLTEVQISILDYIKQEIRVKNYPPSVREISEKVGLKSTSSVQYQLNNLTQKGYLKRDPQKPRALKVVKDDNGSELTYITELVNVPILGRVAAGTPILAQEDNEDFFPLPTSMTRGNECFILQVQGESMIEAGILPEDMLIVSRQSYLENGEIGVCLIDNEATVKTFYKENGYYRLQPENSAMEPILTKTVLILGKVIGVIRKY